MCSATAEQVEPKSKTSLRRLQQRRRAGAELLEQCRFVGLRCLEVAQLDVAEAADFFRDCREADREMMIIWSKPSHQLIEQRLVIAHELPLDAPLRGIAERIERSAAQEFQTCQHAEHAHHPGTEAHLA